MYRVVGLTRERSVAPFIVAVLELKKSSLCKMARRALYTKKK
jgi:hypothetical protein